MTGPSLGKGMPGPLQVAGPDVSCLRALQVVGPNVAGLVGVVQLPAAGFAGVCEQPTTAGFAGACEQPSAGSLQVGVSVSECLVSVCLASCWSACIGLHGVGSHPWLLCKL